MNKFILIRHAHSSYTADEYNLPLSYKEKESLKLLDFLNEETIDYIYSSPYQRAIETVALLAENHSLSIRVDNRLKERKLASSPVHDFDNTLIKLWSNPHYSLEGGESNFTAQCRIRAFVDEMNSKFVKKNVVLSSHGNIISLLLNSYDSGYDFNFWKQLKMPAVIVLSIDSNSSFEINKLL